MHFGQSIILTGILVFGCAGDTDEAQLAGSVGEIHSLAYSTVRAQIVDDSVSIEYRDREGTLVAINFNTGSISGPGTFAIPDEATVVMNRYSNPSVDLIPTSGQLTLESFEPTANAEITGRFEASIIKDDPVSDDSQTMKTYSVRGDFDTTLTQAD